MEVIASQGIIGLLISLLTYAGLVIALGLLFDKRTMLFGLLGILASGSIGFTYYTYSYWAFHSGGTEALASSLLLPLFGLSLSIALFTRLYSRSKRDDTKTVLRTQVKKYLPITVGLLITVSVVYYVVAGLAGLTSNLLIPYVITVLIALAWSSMSHTAKLTSK